MHRLHLAALPVGGQQPHGGDVAHAATELGAPAALEDGAGDAVLGHRSGGEGTELGMRGDRVVGAGRRRHPVERVGARDRGEDRVGVALVGHDRVHGRAATAS